MRCAVSVDLASIGSLCSRGRRRSKRSRLPQRRRGRLGSQRLPHTALERAAETDVAQIPTSKIGVLRRNGSLCAAASHIAGPQLADRRCRRWSLRRRGFRGSGPSLRFVLISAHDAKRSPHRPDPGPNRAARISRGGQPGPEIDDNAILHPSRLGSGRSERSFEPVGPGCLESLDVLG